MDLRPIKSFWKLSKCETLKLLLVVAFTIMIQLDYLMKKQCLLIEKLFRYFNKFTGTISIRSAQTERAKEYPNEQSYNYKVIGSISFG